MRTPAQVANDLNKEVLKTLLAKPGKVPSWIHYSRPYISAMLEIEDIQGKYYLDTAYEVVLRCLCNLQSWRGERARELKAELKALLDTCPESKRV